ncbi:MAG: L-threonylcarbamoyladenylate synthase [Actinomycetota bacterium]
MADILQSDPVRPSKEAVVAAALVVKAGGLAVLPTDTVYGLVADFKNPAAVERLYELKGRPDVKGLPLFVGDRSQLDLLVTGVPDETCILMDMYWPGPLTIVFNKKPEVPDLVTGGLPTVAVRQPGYVVVQAVLQEIGSPLASSSANLSGDRAPRSVAEMAPAVIEGVDIVVDGGVCPRGIPSTILDVSGPVWQVLREGSVTRQAIESAVGRVIE